MYLEALSQVMLTIGRFANDLIHFTSRELDFFKVPNNLVTGSSIMPQKRSLDALEILRANVHVVTNNQNLVKDIVKNLTSGYHRDLQLIKKPLFESTQIVTDSIEIAKLYLNSVTPKKDLIEKKITKDIFMADIAIEMSKNKKVPFRQAYKRAAQQIKKYKIDPIENINKKISLGAAGNLDLNYYKDLLFEKKRMSVSRRHLKK